jgi:hypothetical protein
METLSRTCSNIPLARADKVEATTMTSGNLDEECLAGMPGRSGHLVVDIEGHTERISGLFNNPEVGDPTLSSALCSTFATAPDQLTGYLCCDQFSDVVIVAQQNGVAEGRFSCHKAILCNCCLHFDILFKTGKYQKPARFLLHPMCWTAN